MSILIGAQSRICVQGATGAMGRRQIEVLAAFGLPAVAGVTPGRGLQTVAGVPIFDSVVEAVQQTGADCSIILVPPQAAVRAAKEAVDAGIHTVAIITEGVSVHSMLELTEYLQGKEATVIGPNCLGAISPGQALLGMIAPIYTRPGLVGVLSRSGSLCLEAVRLLSAAGIGQSTVVSVGGDPILGTTLRKYVELFANDPDTRAVVLIGEIGGTLEEHAASAIREADMTAVAFVAGTTAPTGIRMGHLGAIQGSVGEAASKCLRLRDAGVHIADVIWDIPRLLGKVVSD